jgi:CRP-like cAMP-binding protein
VENTILLRLPQSEFDALEPHLEFVQLNLSATLQREFEPIQAVYFMNRGIASILVETIDGRSVEVGIVGREEMIGLQLAAGLDDLTHNLIMQVPGDGFRVPATTMRTLLQPLPHLRRILTRQLGIRSMQFAQNAACNRLHNVKQRLARWLLVTHDRLDTNVITTTHDYLAKMVGTDRPTVSVALADLQREGGILGRRGAIALLNRSKLQQQACECYEVFRQFNVEMGLI